MYASVYDREWREDIREDGNFIGGIVMLITAALTLGFTVLVTVLVLAGVFSFEQLQRDDLGLGNTGYLLLYMCTYAAFMGLPPLLVCLLFRRRMPRIQPPTAQMTGGTYAAAFFLGWGGCAVANYVASYVSAILDSFGIMPPDNPTHLEQTPQSLLLNLAVSAVLPALLEEIAFRKCILGTLQKYGQGIAVVISALLFGVVHGGISQSVFAFIVGLVLGFVTVKTGNIWTAVAVHFINNATSVLAEYVTIGMDETVSGFVYVVVIGIAGVCGMIALFASLLKKSPLFVRSLCPAHTAENCVGILCGAPLMVIAVILLILRALYVNIL